jgi:hypothetical protein
MDCGMVGPRAIRADLTMACMKMEVTTERDILLYRVAEFSISRHSARSYDRRTTVSGIPVRRTLELPDLIASLPPTSTASLIHLTGVRRLTSIRPTSSDLRPAASLVGRCPA